MGQFGVAVGKSKTIIAIMVGVTWSGITAASELISFNEQDTLNSINTAYDRQYSALRVDENISYYNKLNAEI
ncbi:hypothetical protein CGH26_21370, partial [Vibrio parahaemolyticus]